MSNKTRGILLVMLAALVWSTGGIGVKIIDTDPFLIAALRCTFAGMFYISFIKFRKIRFTRNFIFLLICYTYAVSTFVIATKFTTAANAIILQYTAPLWLFLFVSLMDRKIEKNKIFPMAIIGAGIIVFLFENTAGSSYFGNILAITTGLAFGLLTYFLSKLHSINGIGLIAFCNIIAAPVIFLIAPFKGQIFFLSLQDIIVLLYLGVIQIGIGYMLYAKGLQYIEPLNASVIALLEPLINPILVLFFYGEIPGFYGIFGGIIILTGVLINTLKELYFRHRTTF